MEIITTADAVAALPALLQQRQSPKQLRKSPQKRLLLKLQPKRPRLSRLRPRKLLQLKKQRLQLTLQPKKPLPLKRLPRKRPRVKPCLTAPSHLPPSLVRTA